MEIKQALLGLASSLIWLSAAQAQDNILGQNTGQAYQSCKKYTAIADDIKSLSRADFLGAGICIGKIETMMIALHFNCKNGIGIRADALQNTSLNAVHQAFLNYARDNPQTWEEPSYVGMSKAMAKYFPCPN